MIDRTFALKFAGDWMIAWNDHDLARILSHYSDDIEFTSPFVLPIAGERSGTLRGKKIVGAYWERALKQMSGLHFELIDVTVGVDSICIYYHSVLEKKAIEWMLFGPDGKVIKAIAHYDSI
jgi:ketosteroid isomerase-like protein